MQVYYRHGWDVNTLEAKYLQTSLSGEVICHDCCETVSLVAGIDVSVNRFSKTGTAAAVVLDYPSLAVREVQVYTGNITFPYIPGFLSFREAPLVLEACRRLVLLPDLFMVDGQGVAHPRRLGLAAHLGIFLDRPTIGVAKSRLCGEHDAPGGEAGSFTDLADGDDIIGRVVRTKTNVKPVYVSVGNKISLDKAVTWTLRCCRGYRLPEPTRMAHLAAGGNLKTVV